MKKAAGDGAEGESPSVSHIQNLQKIFRRGEPCQPAGAEGRPCEIWKEYIKVLFEDPYPVRVKESTYESSDTTSQLGQGRG